MPAIETEILYTPAQARMIFDSGDVDEVFIGGAAGGGKSEALLLYALKRRLDCPGSTGLMLRRTFPELEKSLIRKSRRHFSVFANYKEQPRQWVFPNGSIQEFGYCASESDVYQYQSAEYDDICFDEMGHFSEFQILYLMSRLRSASGKYATQVRGASNPGNIGHGFLKARYVDVARDKVFEGPEGKTRLFIPAGVDDNTLMSVETAEAYKMWLNGLPEQERKQLLHGDWDYIPGAAFSEIDRNVHMIQANNPPDRLLRLFDFDRMTPKPDIKIFRAMDWGYSKPFSIGWYFSDYEGRIYRYRELYGCKAANEGIQMPARDVAQKIKSIEKEHGEKVLLTVADASIWDKPSNQNERAEKLPSIAETMAEEGVYWDREISIDAKKSRIQGKHNIHERLRVVDGLPNVFVFDTCTHWWRTVPVIPLDKLNPEDVDTDVEDHCLHGDTEVITDKGPVAIKKLVGTSGKILSSFGQMETYTNCRLTRKGAELVKVTFDDNRHIYCTPDHKFLTETLTWVEAKDSTNTVIYDSISYLISKGDKVCASRLLTKPRKSLRGRITGYVENIISARVKGCIEQFTNRLTAKSQQGGMCIIKTVTSQITKLITLNYSIKNRTCLYMGHKTNTQSVARCVLFLNTWTLRHAQDIAARDGRNPKVVSVTPAGSSDVYCLDVPSTHAFAITGGIIVHNCYDEFRYMLSARPYKSTIQKPETKPYTVDWFYKRRDERVKQYA